MASPAAALTMQQCSVKYKAAQDAGTLNGMKWNDFRKANCGEATAPAAGPTATAAAPQAAAAGQAPAKPQATPPAGVVFPAAVDARYAGETPSRARLHTCLDQYRRDKASNGLAGLKWLQKGGGYYSLCNARLKG